MSRCPGLYSASVWHSSLYKFSLKSNISKLVIVQKHANRSRIWEVEEDSCRERVYFDQSFDWTFFFTGNTDITIHDVSIIYPKKQTKRKNLKKDARVQQYTQQKVNPMCKPAWLLRNLEKSDDRSLGNGSPFVLPFFFFFFAKRIVYGSQQCICDPF